jgi:hypothetical protein
MKDASKLPKQLFFCLVLIIVFGSELRGALSKERPTKPEIGPNTFELLFYQLYFRVNWLALSRILR